MPCDPTVELDLRGQTGAENNVLPEMAPENV
jgi:hypothetical protein